MKINKSGHVKLKGVRAARGIWAAGGKPRRSPAVVRVHAWHVRTSFRSTAKACFKTNTRFKNGRRTWIAISSEEDTQSNVSLFQRLSSPWLAGDAESS